MKNTTHDIVKDNMLKAVNRIIETTSDSFFLEVDLIEISKIESDGWFDEVTWI